MEVQHSKMVVGSNPLGEALCLCVMCQGFSLGILAFSYSHSMNKALSVCLCMLYTSYMDDGWIIYCSSVKSQWRSIVFKIMRCVCVFLVVESTKRQPGRGEPPPLESDQPFESAESHTAGEEHGE